MPSEAKTLSAGDILEARVAQLWFWEGFYVKRGVNLQEYYREPLQVTDLDFLAIDINPQLAIRKHIGEVKSGKGAAKPLDRVVWLRGLRALVGADAAELTIAAGVTANIRQLGLSLGVSAQNVADFERREQDAVGDGLENLGSQGVEAFLWEKEVHSACRGEADLERAFWFLRGEVLFLDPFLAIKQLIELLRKLRQLWTPRLNDRQSGAVRWLAAEGTSILAVNLVIAAGRAVTLDRDEWNTWVNERLAEGAIPIREMRKLSNSIDKFIAGMLSTSNASAEMRTEAIGAFLPEPPDYSESLAELCWRLKSDAPVARALPRQIDLLMFESLVYRRKIGGSSVTRMGLERESSARLRRLVAAFMRGCGASFEELDKALIQQPEVAK